MILSLCLTFWQAKTGNLRDSAYVLVDSVGRVCIYPVFNLGRSKELGCFCDILLREDKTGKKGVN